LKVRRKCTIGKAEEEFVTWWCHLRPSIVKKFTLQENEKGTKLVFSTKLVLMEVSPPDLNLSHLHLLFAQCSYSSLNQAWLKYNPTIGCLILELYFNSICPT
jgi:hypothetical protein